MTGACLPSMSVSTAKSVFIFVTRISRW